MSYYRSSGNYYRPDPDKHGGSTRYGGSFSRGYGPSAQSSRLLERDWPSMHRQGRFRPRFDDSWWIGRRDSPLYTEDEEEDERAAAAAAAAGGGVDLPRPVPFGVDLHLHRNRSEHHTADYEAQDLLVRRGQQLHLTVTLPGRFDKVKDAIKLQFAIGKTPQESKGTLVRLTPGGDALTPAAWGTVLDAVDAADDKTVIKLRAQPAANCIVGKYTVYVEDFRWNEDEDKQTFKRHKVNEPVYVLFNAWCKDDVVYMADEAERQEYVLNESGRLYVGTSRSISARPWNYGQFEEPCVEAALYLLGESSLPKQAQGNPTLVTRALSAMVNSCDDNGVLTGNWSGSYLGGTSPSSWNSSVAILDEYMCRKKSVRFGQCWVFSGVTTTLCRTLGIPARSVTNFQSAHDTDFSLTIDTHVDVDGHPVEHLNDSVWNFHVWNEAWFARPDLPTGCDGWQAFDATPQEMSEERMQCGPAPVAAIKKGNLYLGYDAKFIFAEVNGDRVTWIVDGFGGMVATSVETDSVGKCISTKAVGKSDRMDLTSAYKYNEGSHEERESIQRASAYSSRKDRLKVLYNRQQDVHFAFDGRLDNSGHLHFHLESSNDTDDARTIDVTISAVATYNTGVTGRDLKKTTNQVQLQPRQAKKTEWSMKADTYINLLDEDANVGIYLLAKVAQTGQIFTKHETFMVEKPELQVQVPQTPVTLGDDVEVEVRFTNPLDVDLTSVSLRIDGTGMKRANSVLIAHSVKSGEEIREKIRLTPKVKGQKEVIVNLTSKQLIGIVGAASVRVLAKP